jgi:hypothetical protein
MCSTRLNTDQMQADACLFVCLFSLPHYEPPWNGIRAKKR